MIRIGKGKPADDAAITRLERLIGSSVSESVKRFWKENDGAKPETNIFSIDERNEYGVNRFIPIAEIFDERQKIENLPSAAYPIAWADGGNYVLVDEGRAGAVYFWEHE